VVVHLHQQLWQAWLLNAIMKGVVWPSGHLVPGVMFVLPVHRHMCSTCY
jgi:hypothetical protein